MNRLDRIEAKLAESESTDRDFPREPERREIIVRRDDLRALVRLARATMASHDSDTLSNEENDALAALEEPCEP